MSTYKDEMDQMWDRANFAVKEIHKEMDEFLERISRESPKKTKQEKEQMDKQFLEIQERANRKCLEIYRRAESGDKAPHIREVY